METQVPEVLITISKQQIVSQVELITHSKITSIEVLQGSITPVVQLGEIVTIIGATIITTAVRAINGAIIITLILGIEAIQFGDPTIIKDLPGVTTIQGFRINLHLVTQQETPLTQTLTTIIPIPSTDHLQPSGITIQTQPLEVQLGATAIIHLILATVVETNLHLNLDFQIQTIPTNLLLINSQVLTVVLTIRTVVVL